MRRLQTLLAFLAVFLLSAQPTSAAAVKPLVNIAGRQQVIPDGDTLQTSAPTSANASLNLPHGTAPASPVNGDCWTTTAGLYCRIFGATVGPYVSTATVGAAGSSGQIQYNNGGAFGGFTLAGDCTFSVPNITCTKTSGVSFGAFATGTNAANLTGTVASARLSGSYTGITGVGTLTAGTWNGSVIGSAYGGAGAVSGILKANGSGTVSAAASGTDYAPPTSGAALLYGNGAGGFSNASVGVGLSFSGGVLLNTGDAGSASWTANPFCSTVGGGNPCIRYGSGAPSASDPTGSIDFDVASGRTYSMWPAAASPTEVQNAKNVGSMTVTLGVAPTVGNWLIASCFDLTAPTASGTYTLEATIATDLPGVVTVRQVQAGDTTTQTPCAGGSSRSVTVVTEVSGLSNVFAANLQTIQSTHASNGGGVTINYTTTSANTLAIGAGASVQGSTANNWVISGSAWVHKLDNVPPTNFAGGETGGGTGNLFSVSNGTALSFVTTSGSFSCCSPAAAFLIVLQPADAANSGYQPVSYLTTVKNAGTTLNLNARSLNFSTGLTPTDDGEGNITVAAVASGAANPTATASDTAVNGSAATYMRSDAAPAVQKASSSVFGLVKCDGTTITCTSGVIAGTGPTISSGSTGNCVQWTSATALGNSGAACGAGGGGTTNNYYAGALTLIQTQTPSGTGAVTFSSIPQGYTDLVLVTNGASTAAATNAEIHVTLNGDTGANYDYQYSAGNNASFSGTGVPAASYIMAGWLEGSTVANTSSIAETTVSGYAQSTFQKSLISHSGVRTGTVASSMNSLSVWGDWRNAAAVTSLTATLSTGNFAAGSTVSLYGRGGSNVTINPQPGLPVISETVTSGSQPSVTVSAIPSTYRDLKIVASARGTNASIDTQIYVQLNGDTGSNYDTIGGLLATSGWAYNYSGLATTQMQFGYMPAASAPANWVGLAEITIGNYAGTNFYKSLQGTAKDYWGAATADLINWHASGQWRSTAAVTSLKIYPGSGNFADGTVITVYGIGGSPTATLPVIPPEGRLSLTSGVAVMTADATAQGTIYWVPLPGAMMPVGNIMYRVSSQLSYALNTTAHTSTNLYDIGAYNNAGAITLCTAPAWTNSTTRSSAISQDATNGVWVNTASLTCNLSGGTTTTTIAAGQWTYLGTFYATANGQTGVALFPTAASGGSNPIVGIWNAYNQKTVAVTSSDNGAQYNYTTGTWRAARASNSNRISGVWGLAWEAPEVTWSQDVNASNSCANPQSGVNLDSTSATPNAYGTWNGCAFGSGEVTTPLVGVAPLIGFHYFQGMEKGATNSAFGGNIGTLYARWMY